MGFALKIYIRAQESNNYLHRVWIYLVGHLTCGRDLQTAKGKHKPRKVNLQAKEDHNSRNLDETKGKSPGNKMRSTARSLI